MFGKIELEKFAGLEKLSQEAASAWSSVANLVGANYKPLLYLGRQQVNGVNHFFIAEQTLLTNPPIKRVVRLVINSGAIVDCEEIL